MLPDSSTTLFDDASLNIGTTSSSYHNVVGHDKAYNMIITRSDDNTWTFDFSQILTFSEVYSEEVKKRTYQVFYPFSADTLYPFSFRAVWTRE